MESSSVILTIAEPAEAVYKVKASKFLAFAYPVQNEDEIKAHLQNLKKNSPTQTTTASPGGWGLAKTNFAITTTESPRQQLVVPFMVKFFHAILLMF